MKTDFTPSAKAGPLFLRTLAVCALLFGTGCELRQAMHDQESLRIEGAHTGAGLGHRFLGHVERCRILLHLIDATGEDPVAAWRTLRAELKAYGGDLYEKPELVALTKLDATPEDYADDLVAALQDQGADHVMCLSAVTGRGVTSALRALVAVIEESRAKEAEPEDVEPWSP